MAYPYGYAPYGYNPQQTFMPQQNVQQPQMQAPQMAQAFACHPVTSREEAVAAQTDYFSAGLIMPDLSKGMIYLKRFNAGTGSSDFFEFRLVQAEENKEVRYVTVEEFEKFKADFLARKATVKKKAEVAEDDE